MSIPIQSIHSSCIHTPSTPHKSRKMIFDGVVIPTPSASRMVCNTRQRMHRSMEPSTPTMKRQRIMSEEGKDTAWTRQHAIRVKDVVEEEEEDVNDENAEVKVISIADVYRHARARLHPSFHGSTSQLLSREREFSVLSLFFQRTLVERSPGAMFISGPPGGGKSMAVRACLSSLMTSLSCGGRGMISDRPRVAMVNCVGLTDANDVYTKVLEAMSNGNEMKHIIMAPLPMDVRTWIETGDTYRAFMDLANNPRRRLLNVVVLDEMDSLVNAKNGTKVAQALFDMALDATSKCIVVGIANDAGVLEKVFPATSKTLAGMELCHFSPYSHQDVLTILRQRLTDLPRPTTLSASAVAPPLIAPSLLELVARKSIARGGAPDLRRILSMTQRAVTLAHRDWEQALTIHTPSEASPEPPMVTVSVAHVLRAIKETDGVDAVSPLQRVTGLSLQQKLVLVALVKMVQDALTKQEKGLRFDGKDIGNEPDEAPTPPTTPKKVKVKSTQEGIRLGVLQEVCIKLCRQHGICTTLTSSDVTDLVRNLSGRGGILEMEDQLRAVPGKKRGWDGMKANGSDRDKKVVLLMQVDYIVKAIAMGKDDPAGGAMLFRMLPTECVGATV